MKEKARRHKGPRRSTPTTGRRLATLADLAKLPPAIPRTEESAKAYAHELFGSPLVQSLLMAGKQLATPSASPTQGGHPGKVGRTPVITEAEFRAHVAEHPLHPQGHPKWLSDGSRATMLTFSLKRHVSRLAFRHARIRWGRSPE